MKHKQIESWVKIDKEGKYSVSNTGKVRNNRTCRLLYGRKNTSGYYQVGLSLKDGQKWLLIHRIVADIFIPNLGGFEEIDHIDGDKSNNNANNLRWVTSSENKLNIPKIVRKRKHGKRKIIQLTLDGEFVAEWYFCPFGDNQIRDVKSQLFLPEQNDEIVKYIKLIVK